MRKQHAHDGLAFEKQRQLTTCLRFLGRIRMQKTDADPAGNQGPRDALAIDADDALGANLVLLEQALCSLPAA